MKSEPSEDSPQLMRQIILAYLDSINAHDVNGIVSLMSEDFQYINSAGDAFRGPAYMRQEWRKYFDTYPDFQIHVQKVIAGEEGVAVFGMAEATYSSAATDPGSNHWLLPAAYLGITRGGKITHWQTFADSSIVFDIIKEQQGSEAAD